MRWFFLFARQINQRKNVSFLHPKFLVCHQKKMLPRKNFNKEDRKTKTVVSFWCFLFSFFRFLFGNNKQTHCGKFFIFSLYCTLLTLLYKKRCLFVVLREIFFPSHSRRRLLRRRLFSLSEAAFEILREKRGKDDERY